MDDNGAVAQFDLEHVCVDVVEDIGPAGYRHRFQVVVNNTPVDVWIKWDPNKRKYWLKSDVFSSLKWRENPRVSLARRLNQKQPFRIVVGVSSTVYAYGGFYDIDLGLQRTGGPGSLILSLIRGVTELASVTSEKGNLTRPAATWPTHSLFHVIDRSLTPGARIKPFGEPFPALVCDDLGNEIADFIGVDEAISGGIPRAVFIIAKWKSGAAGAGASSLYDVCGQAAKNLAYLKGDARELPGGKRWNNVWSLNGGRVPRIRAGGTATAIRNMFGRVRANPNSQRAVWMVLGGGILSRSTLEQELRRANPRPHVLQLVHLILSVYASCQSIGVDFRIFCAN